MSCSCRRWRVRRTSARLTALLLLPRVRRSAGRGSNTPLSALALDLNDLCLRAGAYQNSLFVVGIAKAGIEDGMELIGGSCIVSPLGQVLAKAASTGDELIAARIDLDHMTPARKRWDFFGRRHPEYWETPSRSPACRVQTRAVKECVVQPRLPFEIE